MDSSDRLSQFANGNVELEEDLRKLVDVGTSEEESLEAFLEVLYNFLSDAGTLTLGMDDFIMSLASTHETHLYLLKQKLPEYPQGV
jgi:hypothetical protein